MNGSSISAPIDRSAFNENPPCDFSAKPASNGVMNMPIMLDAEALQSAAGTLPPSDRGERDRCLYGRR